MSRPRPHFHRSSNRLPLGMAAALILLIGAALIPFTRPATAAPAFGANVYQGLLVVTTGDAGDSLLELGNNGTDIAGSGLIRLRPDGLPGTSAITIEKNGSTNRADLHVRGGVCFADGTCADVFPSASGGSYWELIADHYLQPKTISNTVTFTPATANLYLPALDLVANNSDYTLQVSNKIGVTPTEAAAFQSGAILENDLMVGAHAGTEIIIQRNTGGASYPNWPTGTSTTISYPVWHAGNDGHTDNGTGPDASKLDSISLEFWTAQVSNQCGGVAGANCFCVQFPFANFKCLALQ